MKYVSCDCWQLLDRKGYKMVHAETDSLLQMLKQVQKMDELLKQVKANSGLSVSDVLPPFITSTASNVNIDSVNHCLCHWSYAAGLLFVIRIIQKLWADFDDSWQVTFLMGARFKGQTIKRLLSLSITLIRLVFLRSSTISCFTCNLVPGW